MTILIPVEARTVGPAVTMSSREIAELTGKRHDNVMPVCRSLRDSGVCPEIQETPWVNPQNGQTYLECRLNKRDSLVLIARLSPEFTAAVVDRWQQLEAAQAPRLPQTFAQALRLAAEQQEEIERQQIALEAAAPAVAFHSAVSDAVNCQTVEEVAKVFNLGRNRFFQLLRDQGFLLDNNLPAQHHLDAGRFRVIERQYTDRDGESRTYTRTLITGKGLTYIQQRLDLDRETVPRARRPQKGESPDAWTRRGFQV